MDLPLSPLTLDAVQAAAIRARLKPAMGAVERLSVVMGCVAEVSHAAIGVPDGEHPGREHLVKKLLHLAGEVLSWVEVLERSKPAPVPVAEVVPEQSGGGIALPTWAEMTDGDKGAALLHLWRFRIEPERAAREDPCRYVDDPRLVALRPHQACEHAQRLGSYQDLRDRHGDAEIERLYELALDRLESLPATASG